MAVADDGRATALDQDADEALAAAALDYATRSARFAGATLPRAAGSAAATRTPPAPGEIVLRFHCTIYSKIVRALVGRTLTIAGMAGWAADAACSAAQALSCAARSREALKRFAHTDERNELTLLLDDIVQQLSARFPDAVAWRGRCLQRAAHDPKGNPDFDECEN